MMILIDLIMDPVLTATEYRSLITDSLTGTFGVSSYLEINANLENF